MLSKKNRAGNCSDQIQPTIVSPLLKMATIQFVIAREVWDASGYPTIECDVFTAHAFYRASVPSDVTRICRTTSSTPTPSSSSPLNVSAAVTMINTVISPALKGHPITDQTAIDQILSELPLPVAAPELRVNVKLAVSTAVARGGASEKNIPLYRYVAEMTGNNVVRLPVPFFNVINGGPATGNELPFREFLVAPTGATSFHEAAQLGCEFIQQVKALIKTRYGQEFTNVNEKGGFAPPISEEEEALQLLVEVLTASNLENKMKISIIVGANDFYDTETRLYNLAYKKALVPPVKDEAPCSPHEDAPQDDPASDAAPPESQPEEGTQVADAVGDASPSDGPSGETEGEPVAPKDEVPEPPAADSEAPPADAEDPAAPPPAAEDPASLPPDAEDAAAPPPDAEEPPAPLTPPKPPQNVYLVTSSQLITHYVKLVREYPIVGIIDGMADADEEGSLLLMEALHRIERGRPTRDEEEETERVRREKEEEERKLREEEERRKREEEEERLRKDEVERRL
jgi:enolase